MAELCDTMLNNFYMNQKSCAQPIHCTIASNCALDICCFILPRRAYLTEGYTLGKLLLNLPLPRICGHGEVLVLQQSNGQLLLSFILD